MANDATTQTAEESQPEFIESWFDWAKKQSSRPTRGAAVRPRAVDVEDPLADSWFQ